MERTTGVNSWASAMLVVGLLTVAGCNSGGGSSSSTSSTITYSGSTQPAQIDTTNAGTVAGTSAGGAGAASAVAAGDDNRPTQCSMAVVGDITGRRGNMRQIGRAHV